MLFRLLFSIHPNMRGINLVLIFGFDARLRMAIVFLCGRGDQFESRRPLLCLWLFRLEVCHFSYINCSWYFCSDLLFLQRIVGIRHVRLTIGQRGSVLSLICSLSCGSPHLQFCPFFPKNIPGCHKNLGIVDKPYRICS